MRGSSTSLRIASHTVLPGLAAYCSSKAAVSMMTQGLGARVGAARHRGERALPRLHRHRHKRLWWPTEGGQKQLKGFPRRRLMNAEDLDAAFLMLTGPAAKAITGSIITVDDGQSLPGGG
jgi:NAD(P)-dependent dehydrogenase (short-subunit alcohol dehydrogenase family)